MALYELRTYTLYVGKMAEATKLYQEFGWPAIQKGGHDKHLVGYFQGDTGTINQIVHLWKFEDDADRRALGSIVDDDEFPVLERLRSDALQGFGQEGVAVAGRHHDADERARVPIPGHPIRSMLSAR
mgnify:CR=1 FL=1